MPQATRTHSSITGSFACFSTRGGLRSGEIWVEGSRRYANPTSYLISADKWPRQREDALALTGMPASFSERLAGIGTETACYLDDLEALLADPDGPVRLDEDCELHISPLSAGVLSPEVVSERDAVVARLPVLPLSELLIEVDRETGSPGT